MVCLLKQITGCSEQTQVSFITGTATQAHAEGGKTSKSGSEQDARQGKKKNKGVIKWVEKFSISTRLNEAVSAEGRQMMLLATINPSKMDLN